MKGEIYMRQVNWGQIIRMLALIICGAILISLLMGLALVAVPGGYHTPEIGLTILLVTGLTGLVTLLVLAVVIFRALGISDSTRAFGLPEGTIRAMLAIGLILIFSMVSVFLYYQSKQVDSSKIESITEEQLAGIPASQIISISTNSDNSSRYDVIIKLDNQVSNDIAKTLLTTVGTLAVAVAGFYFGTQSVAAARGAMNSPEPVIRNIDTNEVDRSESKSKNIEISGKNFQSLKTVSFTKGSRTIQLEEVTSSNSIIRGKFTIPKDLKDDDIGKYRITVSTDGGEDSLDDKFEITNKGKEPAAKDDAKLAAEDKNKKSS
jgi:hypothetical protein